jgi:hypothetical protein
LSEWCTFQWWDKFLQWDPLEIPNPRRQEIREVRGLRTSLFVHWQERKWDPMHVDELKCQDPNKIQIQSQSKNELFQRTNSSMNNRVNYSLGKYFKVEYSQSKYLQTVNNCISVLLYSFCVDTNNLTKEIQSNVTSERNKHLKNK